MDATEVAQEIATALHDAKIPYAIGGAIAYGFFGPPRGTFGVDVNVFVDASEAPRVLDALAGAGLSFDRESALNSADERGDAVAYFGAMRVDLFFNAIPAQISAQHRTIQVVLHGRPIHVLAPEDTAVFKLLFFRGKDIVDLERLLPSMGEKLDRDYVRRGLIATVGEDDHRVRKWDELCVAFPPV